jgi:hypothetical protein
VNVPFAFAAVTCVPLVPVESELAAELEVYRRTFTVAPASAPLTVSVTVPGLAPAAAVSVSATGFTVTEIVYDPFGVTPLFAVTVNEYVPAAAGVKLKAPLLLLTLNVPAVVPFPDVAPPAVHVPEYVIVDGVPLAVCEFDTFVPVVVFFDTLPVPNVGALLAVPVTFVPLL